MLNTNDENKSISKPKALKNFPVVRTVSSGYEQTAVVDSNLPLTAPSTTTTETNRQLKLNDSAPAYIPKKFRDTQTIKEETKEAQQPATTTPSLSASNVTGFAPKQINPPIYQPTNTYQVGPNSMLPNTYLNAQIMYNPQHVVPGYFPSPGKIATNQFIYPPYGGYPGAPSGVGYNPMVKAPLTTPQPATPLAPLKQTSTKTSFNKDAIPYYPKNYKIPEKTESQDTEQGKKEEKDTPEVAEEETQPQQNEKTEKEGEIIKEDKVEKIEETEPEKEEKVDQKLTTTPQEKEKEKEPEPEEKENHENHEPVKPPIQPAAQTSSESPKLVIDTKKVEKVEKGASKLKDLFDKEKKDSSKNLHQVKKSAVAPSTTYNPPAANKSKNYEIQKAIEEKSRQLKKMGNTPQFLPIKPVKRESKSEYISKSFPIGIDREKETDEKVTQEEEQQTTAAPVEEPVVEEKIQYKVEREYFLINEKEDPMKYKNHIYDIEYMNSFKTWKICKESKLLSKMMIEHLEEMKTYEDDQTKPYERGGKKDRYNKSQTYQNDRKAQASSNADNSRNADRYPRVEATTITSAPATIPTSGGMEQWGRKDISKEVKMAEVYKQKLQELRDQDPIRFDLTELLNILTVDNYDETKRAIFEKIKDSVEDQVKFLEVLFKKAVHEKAFVSLYAKLCKDLDRDLPQKSDKASGKTNTLPSIMRSKLLEKCKEIFKLENNTKFDHYIKVSDPDEREVKLKKFLLGNVNFIGELINTQTLSKKIVFQCINNLFLRIEKSDTDSLLRQINLEGIVILMDKFGTLISKQEKKIKAEDLQDFYEKIDLYIQKLDIVQQNDETLPGHIKYRIINLIEKKKNGWEESKFEKTTAAKGKEDVRKEFEESLKLSMAGGKSGKKLDQDQLNRKIRDDLYSWRDHLKCGYDSTNYNWEITDTIFKVNKNSMAEVITAYAETCIDLVQNLNDLQYAYSYLREVIGFYSKKMPEKERVEIVDKVLELIQYLNDMLLDNNLLLDVWGGVLYLLECHKIFFFQELDRLQDLTEEQLKSIFDVIGKALEYYDKKEDKLKEIYNVRLVKENKSLFSSSLP